MRKFYIIYKDRVGSSIIGAQKGRDYKVREEASGKGPYKAVDYSRDATCILTIIISC